MASKKQMSKQARRHSKNKGSSVDATEYSGPVLRPLASKDDTTTTVLSLFKTAEVFQPSSGYFCSFCFRTASSASIPATISGNWAIGAPDATSWGTWSTEFGSFRVLGVHVTINPFMTDSTNGFGGPAWMSLILRDNNVPTLSTMFDSPTLEMHPISTTKNIFTREMKMQGVDEAEWVETGNAYTAISPQPRLVVYIPPSADYNNVDILVRWRVQFRSRL